MGLNVREEKMTGAAPTGSPETPSLGGGDLAANELTQDSAQTDLSSIQIPLSPEQQKAFAEAWRAYEERVWKQLFPDPIAVPTAYPPPRRLWYGPIIYDGLVT